jgi:small subunit ribosomal protein S2
MFIESKIFNKILNSDLYLGHNKKLLNPLIISYLYGIKKEKVIFKFHEIMLSLRIIYIYTRNLLSKDFTYKQSIVLFFSNHPIFHSIIKKSASSSSQPYMVKSWIGGLLSNSTLGTLHNSTEFDFPQAQTQQSKTLPSILFISHFKGLGSIFKELTLFNIPIITIVDSDICPSVVDYPIFGNDDSTYSVYFYANFVSLLLNKFKAIQNTKYTNLLTKSNNIKVYTKIFKTRRQTYFNEIKPDFYKLIQINLPLKNKK